MKQTIFIVLSIMSFGLCSQEFDMDEYARENPEEYAKMLEYSKKAREKCLDESQELTEDENIRCGMNKISDKIFAVYNKALESNPKIRGKVVTRITISKEGEVLNAECVASEIPIQEVKDSIVEVIKTAKFRPMESDTTRKYTMDFSPNL